MEKAFHSEALNGLCSKDQLDLLNSIDLLRSQGISHYVSLPQIIVCGDQSSGKSSVLEAISGVSFPIKSNLCTRFPTELVLRKTSHIGVSVSIVPHESRSESERLALGGFQENLDGFDGLPTLIENAKAAMAISTHGRAFSKDLLRVEVSGPDRPHLTIVDLPGLIHSQTKQQSASDVELVQDVVQDYMKEPRSIILAVVSAKNDYANQIVLKLARAADREGNRTLGVVTKPDSLVPRSESEAMYVSLARNQDVEFRLGWHVLRNMDSELGECSLSDRDKTEKDFFSKGIWQELSPLILGVEKLRNRLSTVLLGQIAAELPSLIHEIEIKASTCRSKLDMLGKPRATLDEQRAYLLHISQSFQSLVKASVDGTYNDPFFEDAMSDTGYQKRIRAVVQNLNIDFADHIAKRGHCREIVESSEDMVPKGVTATTREEFLDHIQHLMQRTRGRELPGTFNPMIVADLFLEQSTPWEMIARKHVEKAWNAAQDFLNHLVASVADLATSGALFQKIFEPALKQLLDILNTKTIELLTPHQKSHPITYSPYFTEIHHKVRKERNKAEHREILKAFFGVNSLESVYLNERSKDLRPLLTALVDRTEPDLNRFACSEALDCMEAYYKVALKRFVDDIAVEVIEVNLLSMLSGIFSPLSIMSMAEDIVTSIAGELEASRTQREQLTRQLDVLMRGAETCKRFVGIRIQSLEAAINRLGPMNKSTAYDSTDSDNESHSSAHHGVSSLPGSISSEKSELSISNIPSPSIVPVASLKEAPEQSFPSLSSRKPKAIKFQKNTVFV